MFIKAQNHSIGAFFRFAKATTDQESSFYLERLKAQHLKADKVDAFLEYWQLHAGTASGQSAIAEFPSTLGMFTSNNSETINKMGSVNTSCDAARSKLWVDFVTHHLSSTRSFFACDRKSVQEDICLQGNAGKSAYTSEKIATQANAGRRLFTVQTIYPEDREKPFSITPVKETNIVKAIKEILLGSFPPALLTLCTFVFLCFFFFGLSSSAPFSSQS